MHYIMFDTEKVVASLVKFFCQKFVSYWQAGVKTNIYADLFLVKMHLV